MSGRKELKKEEKKEGPKPAEKLPTLPKKDEDPRSTSVRSLISSPAVSETHQVGESLQEYSEGEWAASKPAYSAELLNVKKNPDCVTVFAAPAKPVAEVPSRRPTNASAKEKTHQERLSPLVHLLKGVADILLQDRESTQGIEVKVSMKVQNGAEEDLTAATVSK